MFTGPLRIGRRGASSEIGHNHVGENGARLGEIEGSERRVHRDLPEILAPTQKFGVDRADLVESFAQPVEVVDQLDDLLADGVRYIISARSSARLTDHKISLRPVSRSIDAVAVWPATALVGLG
jgi:hypothetical protein